MAAPQSSSPDIDAVAIRKAFDDWAWHRKGEPIGYMSGSAAARVGFEAGIEFARASLQPATPTAGETKRIRVWDEERGAHFLQNVPATGGDAVAGEAKEAVYKAVLHELETKRLMPTSVTLALAITDAIMALRSPDVAGDVQAATPRPISKDELHAIGHARYLVEQANPDNPEVCFDYELVRNLLDVIDRDALRFTNDAQPLGVDAVELRGHLIETCASICKVMREKHSSPVGDAYANGGWDQGVRIEQAIRGLAAALALPSTDRPPGNPEKEERERLDRWGIGQ